MLSPTGADKVALRWLWFFAIFLVVGAVVAIPQYYLIYLVRVSPFSPFSLYESSVGIVITETAYLFLALSLGSLSKVDRSNFSAPATLSILLIIALPIETFSLFYFGALFNSGLPPPGGRVPPVPSEQQLLQLLGYSAMFLVGGIVALVGLVGVVLGMWRVGVRYQRTSFKAAAILIFVPLINIAASIGFLVVIRAVRRRLEGQSDLP